LGFYSQSYYPQINADLRRLLRACGRGTKGGGFELTAENAKSAKLKGSERGRAVLCPA
jgi:predicted nucleic acid-binding Zn ribbon protein